MVDISSRAAQPNGHSSQQNRLSSTLLLGDTTGHTRTFAPRLPPPARGSLQTLYHPPGQADFDTRCLVGLTGFTTSSVRRQALVVACQRHPIPSGTYGPGLTALPCQDGAHY